MHDAIAAERRGIPAVAVMTDRFEQTARAVTELNGLPDYPYVEELRAKAEAVIARVVSLLTERARS